ncbi:TonB-dependent siderophore receptor [Pseudomonas sp. RIT-To-2]|uniref:TonB-dependent siderophore receptor n=1 Tax=Pseudomonas sp. RIT-To-2 TaxID=3462541 RepID=UPI0024133A82
MKHLPYAPLLLAAAVNLAHAADSTPIQLGAVTVTGTQDTQAEEDARAAREKSANLGPLGERRLLDTPYSINVVPHDLIQNQQLKSVKDILRYLPSVQGDGARPQSRGLQGSVVQNSRLDGLNVVSTTDYPAEQFDDVQVLNGLAGSLYGPANPAGTFNFISKRPTDERLNRVTVGVGTGLSWLKAADLSGPFDPEGKIKYRLNLLDEQGHSYSPGSTLRRQLVSLALDFQVSDDTVVQTNFSHYNYLAKGLPGKFALATNASFPGALDPTRHNLGQNYAGDDDTTDTASLHIKHDFNGNWKLDVGLLRQIADRESTAVTNTLAATGNTYTSTVATATASRFTLNSYLANLNGTEWTGSVRHDLTFGFSGFDWKNFNPVNGATQTLGTASLNDPVNFNEPDYPDFTDRYHSATATQRSFIVGDTLTFTPQWSLMVTGSQSLMSVRNYGKTGATTSGSDDHGLSGAGSLMYKPVDNLTLYVTYADSLQQGDTAPTGTTNANTILAPYRSRQWEIGGKLALDGVNLSLAAFQIKRPYAFTQTNLDYAVAGEQRNRGLEFMADGKVGSNVRLFGGITWLDPKVLDTGSDATSDTRIVGLSRYTASLLTEYQVPQVPGLAVNVNARYVGPRPTDNTDSHWVSSYETFDLGASFTTRLMQRNTVYRLEVTNLTNERYWTNIVPGGLNGYSAAGNASAQLGAPRMLQASIQVDL